MDQVVEDEDADIRVAFQQGNGSWSYLGTVCRQIRVDQPTMNYGWLTPDSTDDELRRVVLHEFGHALGLIHEHQSPNRPISWSRAAVIAELSGPAEQLGPGDHRARHLPPLRPGGVAEHAGRSRVDHDVPDPGVVDDRRLLHRPQPEVVGHRPPVHPGRVPLVTP